LIRSISRAASSSVSPKMGFGSSRWTSPTCGPLRSTSRRISPAPTSTSPKRYPGSRAQAGSVGSCCGLQSGRARLDAVALVLDRDTECTEYHGEDERKAHRDGGTPRRDVEYAERGRGDDGDAHGSTDPLTSLHDGAG